MARRRQLYEGKAKILFEGPEPGTLVQYFKDDATAFNAQKKGVITGKGVLNNRISEYLMLRLAEIGVPTHFVRRLNMREQLIREVEIIPLEVVVRNVAAGSLCHAAGHPGRHPPAAQHHRVLLQERRAATTRWCPRSTSPASAGPPPQDLDDIVALTLRINDFLTGLFLGVGITLVDFKLEFGRLWENEEMRIVLADEISPDNCRLWDTKTGEKMDKDRFRRDLGKVEEALSGSRPPPRHPARGRRARHEGPGDDADESRCDRHAEGRACWTRRARPSATRWHGLGFAGVGEVRAGKVIELDLAETDAAERPRPGRGHGPQAAGQHRHRELLGGAGLMRAGIVVFPGINRERDMAIALDRAPAGKPRMVWHRDADLCRPRSGGAARRLQLWRLSALRRHGRAVPGHGTPSAPMPRAAGMCWACATASRF